MGQWAIDPMLRQRHRCWLGKIEWTDVKVSEGAQLWARDLQQVELWLRTRFANKEQMSADERICAVRDAYLALGTNPKRVAPASEALIKRVLGGKSVPLINTMVDFNNLLSARTRLPVGSYDQAEIRGDVRFAAGTQGDTYLAIGNGEFCAQGLPTLFDEAGPFGCATRDSLRTMVRPATTQATTIVMSFVEPRDNGLLDELQDLVRLAESTDLGKCRSCEWIC